MLTGMDDRRVPFLDRLTGLCPSRAGPFWMGEISEPHDRHRGAFSLSWQPVIDGEKALWRGWRFLIGSSLQRRAGEGMEKEKKHGQRQPDLSTSLALTNACAVCFCFLFPLFFSPTKGRQTTWPNGWLVVTKPRGRQRREFLGFQWVVLSVEFYREIANPQILMVPSTYTIRQL